MECWIQTCSWMLRRIFANTFYCLNSSSFSSFKHDFFPLEILSTVSRWLFSIIICATINVTALPKNDLNFPPLQSKLRVVRAFRSTLEDLEEKRSTHSIHCLRTSRSHPVMSQANRQSTEAAYIDDDGNTNNNSNKPPTTHQNLNTSHNNMIMLV